jgi:N-sulfoglucosamine sulfohydrolase
MKKAYFLLPILAALTGPAVAAVKPNIVLLFADDLGRYAGAYADPAQPSPNDLPGFRTPAFDRVVREGARFNNAFVSAPSCSPSRAALNTGRHFFRNGSNAQLHMPWTSNQTDPFAEVKGVAVALREAGYHTGHTYKIHIKESLIGGKENVYDAAGKDFNKYSKHVTGAEDRAAAKAALLEQVRGNFLAFLAKRGPGQPFYYSFNPTNTHRKWVKGSGKALWGLNPDDLKGKLEPFLPDVPEVREDFADYLGEAMAFDAACGVILAEIEKLGELDNTLVAISGDHGAPGFPRGKTNMCDFGSRVLLGIRWPGGIAAGRVVQTPVSLVDLTPTFLAAAGAEAIPGMDGQSLLPAVREGGDEKALRGWALIGREVHAHNAREGNLPYPVRAIRTPDFLYIINFKPDRNPAGDPMQAEGNPAPNADQWENSTYTGYADIDSSPTKAWVLMHRGDPAAALAWEYGIAKRPAEELYDLRRDPRQMDNLAENPSFAERKQTLRGQLMKILKDGGDPRLDNDAFDKPPYLSNRKEKEAMLAREAAEGSESGPPKPAPKKKKAKPGGA